MSNHNKETEARCPHCYRHYVEGTAAWALYMMRMGHKVTNPKYDPRVYHLPEGGMIHVNGIKSIAGNQWIDYWCIDLPDGWEVYEEPKSEHPAINGYNRYDYIPVEGIRQPKPEPKELTMKFETINGQLCLMLEKPDAINEFSKTPCVIAGKCRGLKKCYILGSPPSNPSMSILAEGFEIVGYPVADGSLEWALYQIRSGKKVVKEGGGEQYGCSFYENRLFYLNGSGYLVTKNAIGLIDPCSEGEFLSLDETGWQLYKPQPTASAAGHDPFYYEKLEAISDGREPEPNDEQVFDEMFITLGHY